MTRQVDFTMKTRGWKSDSTTNASGAGSGADGTGASGVIYKQVTSAGGFYTLTLDGFLAFSEHQQTDLTGIEIKNEVCFPQGWDIQEPTIPYAFMSFATSYQPEGGAATFGLPCQLQCYDIWSTKRIREDDFKKIVMGNVPGPAGFNQVFPGFMNVFDLNDAAMYDPYWDQEQVICARSRFWSVSSDVTKSIEGAASIIRKFPLTLTDDLRWGMMEPIAASMLHHTRIWKMAVPVTNVPNTRIQTNEDWFYTLPPSNQPMMTLASDPGFVERMTMERRSRDV